MTQSWVHWMILALALKWRWSPSKIKLWQEKQWPSLSAVREWSNEHTAKEFLQYLEWKLYSPGEKRSFPSFWHWLQTLDEARLQRAITPWTEWERRHPKCLTTCADASYPSRLLSLDAPPSVLWWSRPPDVSLTLPVGIVGSRKMSDYAQLATLSLVQGLVAAGATIISGCARGIDITAQTAAIRAGGKTIGFLASGIDQASPELQQVLAQNGWLASEFPPGTQVQAWHFQQRNRLIAGMSEAVVVMEAQEMSGSLITAHAAVDQGKNLCVLSPHYTASHRAGILHLIETGASVICDAQDVLRVIGKAPPVQERALSILDQGSTPEEREVLQWLITHNGRLLAYQWSELFPGFSQTVWHQVLSVLEARGALTQQAGVVLLSCMIQS